MTAYHTPVLADEVITYLAEAPAGPIVDGTLGGGGHTARIVAETNRRVIGIDRDADAIAEAGRRLEGAPVDLVRGRFGDLDAHLDQVLDPDAKVAGILLDLGVSSWQLDAPGRGFAFRHGDAPLDMRMNQDDVETAAELIDRLDADGLAKILREFGEVQGAWRLANEMKTRRADGALETTGALADLVSERAPKKRQKTHPATQVFQALRIAVNGELDQLDRALAVAPERLLDHGRLLIISYHSLEDRRTKRAFRDGDRGPIMPRGLPAPPEWRQTWRVLTRKPVLPTDAEIAANPRARSAKMRVASRAPRQGVAA